MVDYLVTNPPNPRSNEQDQHFNERSVTWTDRYRSSPSFKTRLEVVGNAIRAELADATDARVLDFGGGTGVFSEIAATFAPSVICLDRSISMLHQGKAQSASIQSLLHHAGYGVALGTVLRIAGDVQALRPSADNFDLILAIGVLEYLEDPIAEVQFLAQSLRPGARILATVPNPRSPVRIGQRVLDAFHRNHRSPKGRSADQSYRTLRPFGDKVPWRSGAIHANLTLESITPIPMGTSWIRRIVHPNHLITLSK